MPLPLIKFNILASKIKDYSGIIITADKEYLLQSRLQPIAEKYGLADLSELIEYMQENRDEALLIEVIEGMTINESSFFRDLKPFDYLNSKILPEIISKKPHQDLFRIWCAASSTGQEAYSIAMTILENPAFANKKFEIIGTDIDQIVTEKAKEGLYTQFEVQRGIPIHLLIKYFTQEGDQWRVKESLRAITKFDKFNLLENTSTLGVFDIVFCRNVLIYFDSPTKEKVLANITKTMHPHACLFTGGAESLLGLNTQFKPVEGMVNVFKI